MTAKNMCSNFGSKWSRLSPPFNAIKCMFMGRSNMEAEYMMNDGRDEVPMGKTFMEKDLRV